jgi:hypothetical protein
VSETATYLVLMVANAQERSWNQPLSQLTNTISELLESISEDTDNGEIHIANLLIWSKWKYSMMLSVSYSRDVQVI